MPPELSSGEFRNKGSHNCLSTLAKTDGVHLFNTSRIWNSTSSFNSYCWDQGVWGSPAWCELFSEVLFLWRLVLLQGLQVYDLTLPKNIGLAVHVFVTTSTLLIDTVHLLYIAAVIVVNTRETPGFTPPNFCWNDQVYHRAEWDGCLVNVIIRGFIHAEKKGQEKVELGVLVNFVLVLHLRLVKQVRVSESASRWEWVSTI